MTRQSRYPHHVGLRISEAQHAAIAEFARLRESDYAKTLRLLVDLGLGVVAADGGPQAWAHEERRDLDERIRAAIARILPPELWPDLRGRTCPDPASRVPASSSRAARWLRAVRWPLGKISCFWDRTSEQPAFKAERFIQILRRGWA
ncbi:MAG: hypothetical protein F4X76_10090 [Chloroflexi bacterium]|nr:hypothetical protein [Chloroflexota bacterium]